MTVRPPPAPPKGGSTADGMASVKLPLRVFLRDEVALDNVNSWLSSGQSARPRVTALSIDWTDVPFGNSTSWAQTARLRQIVGPHCGVLGGSLIAIDYLGSIESERTNE